MAYFPFNGTPGRRENSIQNHGDVGSGAAVKILIVSFLILAAVFGAVVWLIEAGF